MFNFIAQLLMAKNLTLVKLLGEVTSEGADREDREHLMQSVIRVFEERNAALDLLTKLTQDEIETTSTNHSALSISFSFFALLILVG